MKESLTENIKTPKTLLETLGEYTSLSKDDQREKYNEYKKTIDRIQDLVSELGGPVLTIKRVICDSFPDEYEDFEDYEIGLEEVKENLEKALPLFDELFKKKA